jgi:hypothetical protein
LQTSTPTGPDQKGNRSMHHPPILRTSPLLILALAVGCSNPTTPTTKTPTQATGGDEAQVKAAFAAVTGALKAHDAEKLWPLLDSDTQADAERAAKAWKEAYAKADADKLKKDLGITSDELAKLTGQGFLKTEPFKDDKRLEELAEHKKIEQVKVDGNQATVEYIEPDDDKETLKFSRQDGQWKVRLKMPMPKQ